MSSNVLNVEDEIKKILKFTKELEEKEKCEEIKVKLEFKNSISEALIMPMRNARSFCTQAQDKAIAFTNLLIQCCKDFTETYSAYNNLNAALGIFNTFIAQPNYPSENCLKVKMIIQGHFAGPLRTLQMMQTTRLEIVKSIRKINDAFTIKLKAAGQLSLEDEEEKPKEAQTMAEKIVIEIEQHCKDITIKYDLAASHMPLLLSACKQIRVVAQRQIQLLEAEHMVTQFEVLTQGHCSYEKPLLFSDCHIGNASANDFTPPASRFSGSLASASASQSTALLLSHSASAAISETPWDFKSYYERLIDQGVKERPIKLDTATWVKLGLRIIHKMYVEAPVIPEAPRVSGQAEELRADLVRQSDGLGRNNGENLGSSESPSKVKPR